MGRIPEDELERIKRDNDLVALVRARGIELRPHAQAPAPARAPPGPPPLQAALRLRDARHGAPAGGTVDEPAALRPTVEVWVAQLNR